MKDLLIALKGRTKAIALAAVLISAGALFWFANIAAVPFHPDESTEIYMSGDLKTLLRSPFGMAYPRGEKRRAHYRLVDAPLTRYAIGVGLALAGEQPTKTDWDWSKTWQENKRLGALPSERQLLAARSAIAALAFASAVLIFAVGARLGGLAAGLLAFALVLLNPLALLHARRAMMEGTLLFGVALTLWAITARNPKPWLVGLAFAIAVNAKPWGIGLLPAAALALAQDGSHIHKKALHRWGIALLTAMLVTFALNPVFWKKPSQATLAALRERFATTAFQQKEYSAVAPFMVPKGLKAKSAVVLGHLYFAPLQFMETGNYKHELAPAIRIYEANPLNRWGRNITVGGLLFILTLLGFLAMMTEFRRPPVLATIIATLGMGSTITLAIPLNFQRYVVGLLPFVELSIAFGLALMLRRIRANTEHKQA